MLLHGAVLRDAKPHTLWVARGKDDGCARWDLVWVDCDLFGHAVPEVHIPAGSEDN